MPGRLRVLELFCGIGGCAAALGDRAEVVAAADINQVASSVYRRNYPHPVHVCAIESLPADRCREWAADLWWLSPPCQPYTVRGRRLDVHDPRAASLLTVIERISEIRPRYVALENVPGFLGSQAYERLHAALDAGGYHVQEQILCPTQLGVPNRRRRVYLIAGRFGQLLPRPTSAWPAAGDGTRGRWFVPSPEVPRRPWWFSVREVLDAEPAEALWLPDELLDRYRAAVHVLDADDPRSETHCFTSSYGLSIVHSGSYLATPRGVRRFSPGEILRLLGFPAEFRLPPSLTLRKAWELVGNSLAVTAVRHVLAAIPELAEAGIEHPFSASSPCGLASADKIG